MRQMVERLLLTVWVGGMWTVGYIVAPTLFITLNDPALAGTIAGKLFTIMSYVGLICGGLLLLNALLEYQMRVFHSWRGLVLIGMLLIVCLGQFVLEPRMAVLRHAGLQGENLHAFMRLHGVAQVLFLLASLGGLSLVLFGLRSRQS
ncbi:MAG: DUF4149 domain-containing protein [Gammaproteobacteria bacterium]|jgi:MFS family permease